MASETALKVSENVCGDAGVLYEDRAPNSIALYRFIIACSFYVHWWKVDRSPQPLN